MTDKLSDTAPWSAAAPSSETDLSAKTDARETGAETEASLLSVRIGPRQVRPAVPEKPGDGLVEAWTRARMEGKGSVDTDIMRAELGNLWETCFWVEYCPERERYIVTPIGRMPPAVSARLKGPHDPAILVRWINQIATRNSHSQDPVVSTTQLDFEAGLTDLELTLAPIDMTGGVVTRYLGALGL